MPADGKNPGVDPRLITKIVASYVSHHNVLPAQIPELIAAVRLTFDQLGKRAEPESALTPAVPIRRSVQREYVVCLDCGWKGKMLRRHLGTRHSLTSEEYLRRWDLPSDHPLTAPAYSQQRSALAKELGLGRGGRPEGAPTDPASAAPSSAEPPRPRRGRPRAGAVRQQS